jgi:hypothetical protein
MGFKEVANLGKLIIKERNLYWGYYNREKLIKRIL